MIIKEIRHIEKRYMSKMTLRNNVNPIRNLRHLDLEDKEEETGSLTSQSPRASLRSL